MGVHDPLKSDDTPSSLRVRTDALTKIELAGTAPGDAQPSGSLGTTLRQLDDDVATYVCRNDTRERVRAFVQEALLRLIFRDDVAGIVVNAHSQGTVLAFDVLSQLPPFAASRVLWLVTSGSPLRKYAEVYCWGNDIGYIHAIGENTRVVWPVADNRTATVHWANFWDQRDPVADPLTAYRRWCDTQSDTQGEAPTVDGQDTSGDQHALTGDDRRTLFQWVNPKTGEQVPVAVADCQVDNVYHSAGGGLRAHNYWDNTDQVVTPLSDLLRLLAEEDGRRLPSGAAEPEPVPVTPGGAGGDTDPQSE